MLCAKDSLPSLAQSSINAKHLCVDLDLPSKREVGHAHQRMWVVGPELVDSVDACSTPNFCLSWTSEVERALGPTPHTGLASRCHGEQLQ